MFDIELNLQEIRVISFDTDYCDNFRDLWLSGALEKADISEDLSISLVDALFREDSRLMHFIFKAEYKSGENLESDNESLFLCIDSEYSIIVLVEPRNESEWNEDMLNKMLESIDQKDNKLPQVFDIVHAQISQSTKDILYKLGINSKISVASL